MFTQDKFSIDKDFGDSDLNGKKWSKFSLEQLRKLEESLAARTGEIDLESKHALDEQVLALLELRKILVWAESLPKETVVGYVGNATACPVYRYLKDAGMRVNLVTPGSVLGNDFALQG